MAEKLAPKEPATIEELAISTMWAGLVLLLGDQSPLWGVSLVPTHVLAARPRDLADLESLGE